MAFPKGFLFGTANADHQVEAYDPKCEDVWDLWERSQGLTKRGKATDFWNRYEEDISNAAAMGLKVFRFSVAWARVEPECGRFDAEAIAHYRKVVEFIRSKDMKVMVTLHHFVWPAWLEREHGGLLGTEFPDLFARYGGKLAESFGDSVDWWITFNEPSQLTFGYIKPWWQSRYYMPPGLPRGSDVDAEAEAVGRLVPNLFRAHARARVAIKGKHEDAKVGVNPLVTGFPTWLQMLMDWAACYRGLGEAVFKFTTKGALVSERSDVDFVIGGVSEGDETKFSFSDPYLRTGKAVIVTADSALKELSDLAGLRVGVIAIGNQPDGWKKDLPRGVKRRVCKNYDEARSLLDAGAVDAVYGDAPFLMPFELLRRDRFRFLVTGLSDEHYVVAAAHGHKKLMLAVNKAVKAFNGRVKDADDANWVNVPTTETQELDRPVSLHELFFKEGELPEDAPNSRGLRRIRRRGKLKVGMRVDAPGVSEACGGSGLELDLARRIAKEVLGDEEALEIVPLEPAERLKVLESKSGWLNWAWRFWGTISLIANANWWYLGVSGRLAEELCPAEAVGAQDFVGMDYYWGLPTWKLHKFRLLEEAAQGRFLSAPVWPRGLYHALRRLHRWFPEQEIFIVENGCTPTAGGVTRAEYVKQHLAEVENALEKGVPVVAYNYWSITSNREWGHAFDPNTDFGLYFVDLDKDSDLKRVATGEVELLKGVASFQPRG